MKQTKNMSGTELWVHSEIKVGREMAIEDFKNLDKKLIGQMAKEAYIKELARLFGVNR
jgi:hypothetical protein